MGNIASQISDMFDSMHPIYSRMNRGGRVPTVDELSNQLDEIDRKMEYHLKNTLTLNKSYHITYMEGYVEGILDILDSIDWNINLVHGFIATYLKVKYLKKYPLYNYKSWYLTLSKSLLDYYDIEFVHKIMDSHFSASSLLQVDD